MGEKSKTESERKELRDQVTAWSKPPDDALRGKCPDAECAKPNCLDPYASVHRHDAGEPIVFLTYTRPDYDQAVRLNGRDIGTLNGSGGVEALCDLLAERHGNSALDDFLKHLNSRLGAMSGLN